MKILVLTLALGLVCAQEDAPSENGAPLVLASLHTFYLGASDPEVISESKPMRGLLRRVEQSQDGKTFSVTFYTKDNGECHLHHVVGWLKEDGSAYTANCESLANCYQCFKQQSEWQGFSPVSTIV